jgi:threonine aldolase
MSRNEKPMIDLRSDTVTLPTPAMREAMSCAELGDDVFGEDPTLQRLENTVAGMLGKESALFFPSGTMANQVALPAQSEPGDEIVLDANAHIYFYESGAMAALAGIMPRLIQGQRGIFSAEDVANLLRPSDVHFPRTRLICVENTHNRGGGSVWPIAKLRHIATLAAEKNIHIHMDGARLWNACAASGISEKEYADCCNTVSVCFSKGLGAPVGSALAGDRDVIQRARRFRKQYGGGMRQAGILGAGALYALEHHRKCLIEDHIHAKKLAKGLAQLPGIEVDIASVETNMVFFNISGGGAKAWMEQLNDRGVRMLAVGPDRMRAVTHLQVSERDIDHALEIISVQQKHWLGV